jgi:hypothetical protein
MNRSMAPPTRTRIAAAVAGLAGGAAVAASAAMSPAQYVGTWAPTYRTFATVYVKAYRPCLKGATNQCADAQKRAAAAAIRTASLLTSSTPPNALAHDIALLERDLRAANRALSTSAVAARAGDTDQRRWCSAEQGPCTIVMIDIGNVIGDINFVAKVDLPLPA